MGLHSVLQSYSSFSLFPRIYAKSMDSGSSSGKKRTALQSIIAGGIAGGIEICITYPTEYVKTQMQLYEELKTLGMIGVGKDTVKKFGIRGLYRGLTPLLAFSIPKSAVRFWAFEEAKKTIGR